MKKTAKVFKNGNSQAIRLPKEYRVATSEVFIEKQNNSIIITQKEENKWEMMKKSLRDVGELDFTREQPPLPSEDIF